MTVIHLLNIWDEWPLEKSNMATIFKHNVLSSSYNTPAIVVSQQEYVVRDR